MQQIENKLMAFVYLRQQDIHPRPVARNKNRKQAFHFSFVAGPAGLGFAIAKPSVPPRSKYREQAPDICSLRRPVEPTVLILLTQL